MNTRAQKIPGPDHPIVIQPHQGHVVVKVAGRVLADTRDARSLLEASYAEVLYIPRKDADMSLLERSQHSTHCPYKGDCSYFGVPSGGERSRNAVWSYENPFAAVIEIQNHLAFYRDRVDSIIVD